MRKGVEWGEKGGKSIWEGVDWPYGFPYIGTFSRRSGVFLTCPWEEVNY